MKANSVEKGSRRWYPCPQCQDSHPSVTSLLDVISSRALMSWLAKNGNAKLKILADVCREVIPQQSEAIFKAAEERWTLSEKTSYWKSGREVGQEAADYGTLAHAWIEAHLNGKDISLASLPQPACNAVKAMLTWEAAHKVKVIKTEQTFYSCKLNMAGTADCVAEVDNELTLIDWKTSSGIFSSYPVQLWGYALADEGQHGDRLYRQVAVGRFGKDGDSEVRIFKRNEFPSIDLARDVLIACNHIFTFLEEWEKQNPYTKKEKPKTLIVQGGH